MGHVALHNAQNEFGEFLLAQGVTRMGAEELVSRQITKKEYLFVLY